MKEYFVDKIHHFLYPDLPDLLLGGSAARIARVVVVVVLVPLLTILLLFLMLFLPTGQFL
jgi:hypothetical protein